MNMQGQPSAFLAISSYDAGSWRVNGTAARPEPPPGFDPNGDGLGDVLLQTLDKRSVAGWILNREGKPTSFASLWSAGASSFAVPINPTCPGGLVSSIDYGPWQIVGTTDLNDDRVADLVLQRNGVVVGWLMNPAGQPTDATLIGCRPSDVQAVATLDLDGDGVNDILFQRMAAFAPGDETGGIDKWPIQAWLMTKNGEIKGQMTIWPCIWAIGKSSGLHDLNGDRILDILLQDSKTTYVAGWIMNGDGSLAEFVPITSYDIGSWRVVGAVDLIPYPLVLWDGIADIILQDSNSTQVAAWVMDGKGKPLRFIGIWLYDAGTWRVNGRDICGESCGPN